MPRKKGFQAGGVRSLQDLQRRCRINEDTHCWEFMGSTLVNARGNVETRIWMADMGTVMATPRASWLLAGKRKLTTQHTVWRRCCNDICCNPAHLMAGTKAEWGAWMAEQGNLKGRPERKLINRRNILESGRTPVTMEIAQWMRESSQTGRDVAHAVGISETAVSRARLYRTFAPLRAASVFTMAQFVPAGLRRAA